MCLFKTENPHSNIAESKLGDILLRQIPLPDMIMILNTILRTYIDVCDTGFSQSFAKPCQFVSM